MKLLTKQTIKIYWQHSMKYGLLVFVLIFSLIAVNAFEIYLPFLYKNFFDVLAKNDFTLAGDLIKILFQILFFASMSWLFWRISTFTTDVFQPKVMSDLFNTCFKYLHDHSYNFFNNNFAGTLVRRVNRYVTSFEDIADIVYFNVGNTFLRVGVILVVLYFYKPFLSLIILIWSVLFISLNLWFVKWKWKYDLETVEIDSKVAGHLSDTVTNNVNLKLFGAAQKEYLDFENLTGRLYAARHRSWRLNSYSEALQGGLMVILEFAILYVAVKFWQKGQLTIGDFALIQAYLIQMFVRLWDLARHVRRIYQKFADAEEMMEILMTRHEVVDKADALELKVKYGKIEFIKVTFGYQPDNDVFKNFNLIVSPGERIALIGPSGGGKSTLVKLLFRFFDLQTGEIFIDGQNIASVSQDSLRANISLVPQDPILFHRTLYENIKYAKPSATKEDVIKAAKLAHCHEFISGFPKKYDTYVGERGVKLSGGERQRVAIARAILKNAPILVLDEATSSLDSESEYLIQDSLKNLMKDRTTIVIAHRLSTIMKMDRIFVLEKGKITEQGTHQELLKVQQGTYQRLWGIQAGGFGA